LVIFSDGLTEAMNGKNAEFGRARLTDLLLRSVALSAPEMRDAILAELRAHTEGCPQSDDVTFITGVVE
jgi:sigma-B regulation protein RsbU (phosphoserine phosphatase)